MSSTGRGRLAASRIAAVTRAATAPSVSRPSKARRSGSVHHSAYASGKRWATCASVSPSHGPMRSSFSRESTRTGTLSIWLTTCARARASAHVVSQMLSVPVRVDSRLNELRMGPWEGLTEAQVAHRFPDAYALWCTLPDRLALDGRETLGAVAARVTAAMRDAASRPRPVLLMTHVAPLRVAVLHSLGLPLRLYKRVHVSNGDCVRVDRARCEIYRLGEDRSLRHRRNLALARPERSVA